MSLNTTESKIKLPETTGEPLSETHRFGIDDLPLFAIYILIAAGSCIGTLLISLIVQKIVSCIKRRDERINLLEEISERSEPEGSSVDCRVLCRSVRRTPERRVEQIYANVSMENEVSVYSNMNAPTQPPTEPNTADDKDADDYINMEMNPCPPTKKLPACSPDVELNDISIDMYIPPFKLLSAPDDSPPGQLSPEAGAQTKDLTLEQDYVLSIDDSLEAVRCGREYVNIEITNSKGGQDSSEGQGSKPDSGDIYTAVKPAKKR